MAHHIHHTEGYILGSAGVGEANRYIIIFTRELGVIGAVAQSVRRIESKLRYALQDFSHARIDVVRGKHSWRITSAQALHDLDAIHTDQAKLRPYVRTLMLVRRLCSGEEPNEELFTMLNDAFSFLTANDLSSSELEGWEVVLSVRMLHNLGYISVQRIDTFLVGEIDRTLCAQAYMTRATLMGEINAALKESQL